MDKVAPSEATKALSPTELDQLANEYTETKKAIDDLQAGCATACEPKFARLEELKTLFVEQVRKFGSAHRDKSKIMQGLAMEVMATFSSYSTIDAAAVETFRLALVKAKQARLLKKLFEKSERWTMARNASELIRGVKLPSRLVALYAQCTVTKERTPALDVRPREKTAASA